MQDSNLLWQQALRLSRAYINALKAQKQKDAELHKTELEITLKKIGVLHGKDT